MNRYYIIAGEASGDVHAANLMKGLKAHDKDAVFRFWGGDRMAREGGIPVKHINELSFMGFWEVLVNLRPILRNLQFCKQDILAWKPDVLILVDYPGFNLRIAEYAHQRGIRVVYYISPMIWAWKQSRIKKIRRVVDKMLVILPFEKDFYGRLNFPVSFPGNPLLDEIMPVRKDPEFADFRKVNNLSDKPIVAVLPGSRKQEISRKLGDMAAMTNYFPDYQFVVAAVSAYDKEFYLQYAGNTNISLVYDQTYPLLANAEAALVASGTAALETALFNVPQVVCYKANTISYHIARHLLKVRYISLVNLIMDKPVVREMIQDDFNREALRHELDRLLYNSAYRSRMKEEYRQLEQKLGGEGASDRAAREIAEFVRAEG
ncbi:MAG: lipid-A-disaccharide synthase [Bacteroidales bacterium]